MLEYQPNRWRPGAATLRAVGIAVPVLLGAVQNHMVLGVLASVGALYAGLASYGGVHRVRMRRMVVTTVVVALLTTIGSLVGPHDWATIIATAFFGILFSLYGASSSENSLVGILGTAILIIVSGLPPTEAGPFGTGALVLAGGLVQTFLIWVLGPLAPYAAERRAIARAYQSLADYVEDLSDVGTVHVPDAEPFQDARARLHEGATLRSDEEHARLRHSLRVAETIRAGLVGYARSHRVVRRMSASHQERADRVAKDLVLALEDIAGAVEKGRFDTDVHFTFQAVDEPRSRECEEHVRWLTLLQGAFEEASRPPVPGETDSTVMAKQAKSSRPFFASITGLLDSNVLRSLTLLHAVRYGLALGIGSAIFRLCQIPLGYWIPLTICFLLRPDYSTTLVKGFARFVGTFAGVALASAYAHIAPAEVWPLTAMVVLGGWFSMALYQVSFTGYIVALTFYVVSGVSTLGKEETVVGLERIMSTGLGVVLAVVASLLWPIWESGRVRQVLREAFKTQVLYGEALVRLVYGGPVEGAEEIRHRARAVRTEAERLFHAAQAEPKWSRKTDLHQAEEWVEALDENAAILLSLHAQALEQRAGRLPDDPQSRQALQRSISEARLFSEALA